MGGAIGCAPCRPPDGRRPGAGAVAVRVLRAGLDRGLAGSGDVAGAAAGAGRGSGLRPGWACRPSGRSPGPGSGSVPRCPSRPGSRAATWAAVRRTGTGSLMPGRTRTRRTPRGGAARTASALIRRPRRPPVDLRAAAGRALGRADRAGTERGRGAVPVRGRPRPQNAPDRRGLDTRHGHHDPGESPVHGPAGVEPAAHRHRAGRPRQRDPRAQVRAAVEPARRMGDLPPARAPGPGQRGRLRRRAGHQRSRGPVPQDEPVLRRYLLAGLLACGLCGRRMESAWSNGKAAYRCRHGRTSAMAPGPSRPKNTYIREDKLLPHLPALHLFLATPATRARRRTRAGADVPGTVSPAEVIGYLREPGYRAYGGTGPGGGGACPPR